ncbi:hypothetical protein PIB30_088745 [Stylosanthes scabra]|uniref:Putative plant transposon protein domain-containing protein n=1 Tax=Stylosanthes scabra TaxID=79078 RepID=A0ABU6ZSI2_9FABA|nr:hypothetical protein [Stylosanthes scabra]
MLVNFSMDRIKTIMKFEGPLNSETSYRARMVEGNQDLDAVTRHICVEGAVWSLGGRNNPLYLKRSELNPVARGWHEFIIHNIMPTTNQSEVTLNRVVLIHCIMSSQEVRVEKIIVDAMMNIINKLHTSKPPLAFPNIIAHLCEEMKISFLASGPVEAMPKARSITPAVMENIRHPPVQPFNPQQHYHHEQQADGYGWGQLQEDMANMSKNQTEFYDSMLAQQTASPPRNGNKATRDVAIPTRGVASTTSIPTRCNMYTHWVLQQSNQNLVPMIPTKIPPAIRDNFKAGRPLFHRMLRPWPPEGSSNALGQQATPAVDVPRNPNAKSDDEN